MPSPRWLLSLLLAACAPPASDGAAEQDAVALRIIDAHVHTYFTGQPDSASGIPDTRAAFLAALEAAGAVGAVAHTRPGGEGWADVSDRGVIHCLGVAARVDSAAVADGLASGRFRCLKIWLGYEQQYAYDPAYKPAYRLAERFDVPVVFHTGDTSSSTAKLKYADPLTLDEVAVDHPNVTFVIAHAGYPWIESAAEVAYKNPNVFIEASAFAVGSLDSEPNGWVDEYVVRPIAWIFGYIEDPSKMMFGSDWPLVDIAEYAAAYRRAIPREHWQAVFHDNAARVFGIP